MGELDVKTRREFVTKWSAMRRRLKAKKRDIILGRQRFHIYKKFYRSNLSLKDGEHLAKSCVLSKKDLKEKS